MADALTAQQTADAVGAYMFSRDRASKGLGMRLVAMSEGAAFLEMTVREDMLNGMDICHGGFITTLADSAFAYACNSTGDLTVAAGLVVDFLAPARLGDLLTARAFEVVQAGRAGLYDITVTNQRGEQVALVRGRAHRMKGQRVMPNEEPRGASSGKAL
ncbi:MAG TPA: hydroxyphenylacetyl-CoA thioesterase PaaI [Caldimonas sp.]